MFFKYIDFIFAPFRAINNKILGVKAVKGNIQVDANRAKAMGKRGQQFAGKANQAVAGQQQQAGAQHQQGAPQQGYPQQGGHPQQGYPQQGYQQGAQPMQQGMPPGMPPGMPGAPGMPPGAPGAPSPNPPVRTQGFWIFAKKFCTQCEQQLDKTWDACPFCAQIAQQAAAAPAKLQKLKTMAMVLDPSGASGAGGIQLLGWIVPLQGPNKGELFTLQPNTVIGTTPDCTIVLQDKFMSSKHAEIKVENGMWVLRDTGSTNGTYVNNKRIDRHELVDNDFIKFGSAMCKFKSL